MKYAITILVALVATLSSCCNTCPTSNAGKTSCCGKAAAPPVAKAAPICSSPLSPACKGECSPNSCFCQPQKCSCGKPAVDVVAKPKPAPKSTVAKKAEPAPTPKPVATTQPAAPDTEPPPAKVKEGVFYWEFSDPKNRVSLPAGSNPAASGFIPDPKTKGWTVVREYEVPAGSVPTPKK